MNTSSISSTSSMHLNGDRPALLKTPSSLQSKSATNVCNQRLQSTFYPPSPNGSHCVYTPSLCSSYTNIAMVSKFFLAFLASLCLVSSAVAIGCTGSATYKVIFKNLLTFDNFGDLPGFPSTGLVFSPLAGVSHSNRQSFFTIRGFANRAVEQIAETGINTKFIRLAKRLSKRGQGVLSVVDVGAPTRPGQAKVLTLKVNCEHPFLTVLGMIAPSPDWIVQINNRNTFDEKRGRFVHMMSGDLIAYDSGVDDGREFTPPLALELDLPTVPQKNIAPLVEDDTDRFDGRVVGKWLIKRIA